LTLIETPDWMLDDLDLLFKNGELREKAKLEREMKKSAQAYRAIAYREAFPEVISNIVSGMTIKKALAAHSGKFEQGQFMSWLYGDPERRAQYNEAKELRAEAWTSRMIELAEGEDETTLDRAKVAIETYKWLASRHSRKEYGDTKTIEMSATISVTAALVQAQERIIEAEVIGDDEDHRLLSSSLNNTEDDE
jgi:hypothetical protein